MKIAEPTNTSRIVWVALRAVMGLLILAAVAAQAQVTVARTLSLGRDLATTMVNFFSYFTILSNLFCAVVLLCAAVWLARTSSKSRAGLPMPLLLACASTYMIVTGLVYNLLLRGIVLDQGATVPWSNEVLHLFGPVYMLIEVLYAPQIRSLPWKAVALALVFPLLWLGYTFIRAPFVTAPTTGESWWYPYPFLDPHLQGGNGPVIGYVVGIAIVISLAAWGVIAIGRWRYNRQVGSGIAESKPGLAQQTAPTD